MKQYLLHFLQMRRMPHHKAGDQRRKGECHPLSRRRPPRKAANCGQNAPPSAHCSVIASELVDAFRGLGGVLSDRRRI